MKEELNGLLKRYQWKRKMEDYAIECGYIPIVPSLLQEYEDFLAENPHISKEQMVALMDGKQQMYFLRPDITSAIIKGILPHYKEGEEVKLCYQSTAYRMKPYGVKEIEQFGVEYFGSHYPDSERELIKMACELLDPVPFIIEVGHSQFIEGLMDELKLNAHQLKKFKSLITTKNAEELLNFSNELTAKSEMKLLVRNLFSLQGNLEFILNKLNGFVLNEKMQRAIENIQLLDGVSESIVFDLSMVNNFDYYNGITFKGYYEDLHKEVLSGGRYEVSPIHYGKEIKAIGFSIDTNAWIRVREREFSWIR